MTSWLRVNWLKVLVVLAIIGTVSGWVRASHYEGVAEANEAQAEVERERADSIQTIRLRERRADSLRTAALRDSADARVARAEEARRREAEARERRERARVQALRSAADLTETLDSLQLPLFERYEADRDSEAEALEAEAESARTRADQAEAEAASLWTAMEAKDDLYGVALDELASKDRRIASLEAANEALRRANASGGIFPDFGIVTKPLYMAVGAGIGYGLGRLGG